MITICPKAAVPGRPVISREERVTVSLAGLPGTGAPPQADLHAAIDAHARWLNDLRLWMLSQPPAPMDPAMADEIAAIRGMANYPVAAVRSDSDPPGRSYQAGRNTQARALGAGRGPARRGAVRSGDGERPGRSA